MHLDDVAVGTALVRVAVLGVLEQDVVHVGAGVLEQLVAAAEHDQSDLTVAQHAQLVRLLHQAELALRERHLYGRIYTTIKTTSEFRNVSVTAQHAQLVRLLHQTELALRERHLYGRIYTTIKTTSEFRKVTVTAQHTQFVGLLHQAKLALRERHLYGRIYTTVKTTRMTWPINTLLEPHIYHEQIILENSFPGNRLHCYGQPNPQ